MKRGDDEADQARSKLIRRNRRQNGPFTDGEVMREVQRPVDRAEVVWAITRVIVLRSDPPPKQEVNVDRSRECCVFALDTERPIDGKIQRR